MEFKNQRDAAAWLIRTGRQLIRSNSQICRFISRSDNNQTFEMGWQLIGIGRRVAMGYSLDNFTKEIYKAHVRSTRKQSTS